MHVGKLMSDRDFSCSVGNSLTFSKENKSSIGRWSGKYTVGDAELELQFCV